VSTAVVQASAVCTSSRTASAWGVGFMVRDREGRQAIPQPEGRDALSGVAATSQLVSLKTSRRARASAEFPPGSSLPVS